MSDKEKILSLLNRYSHTVDGGDIEGFAALYDKGAWYVADSPRIEVRRSCSTMSDPK